MATAPVVPPVPDGSTSPQERGKGRERRERGRGRGRRDRDIVTSASVFSMGPAEKLMQKRGRPEKCKDFHNLYQSFRSVCRVNGRDFWEFLAVGEVREVGQVREVRELSESVRNIPKY